MVQVSPYQHQLSRLPVCASCLPRAGRPQWQKENASNLRRLRRSRGSAGRSRRQSGGIRVCHGAGLHLLFHRVLSQFRHGQRTVNRPLPQQGRRLQVLGICIRRIK